MFRHKDILIMEVLLFNAYWMIYNLSLGVIALSSGWLALKTSIFPIRAVFGAIWLLFIPNTLYVLTDIIHVSEQWGLVGDTIRILLILQYEIFIFLGIVLFVLALYPFEKILAKLALKKSAIVAGLIVINFVIAFGMTMGRIERTNSWEVFINIKDVFSDGVSIATSFEAMMMVVFFGIIGNIIYFSLKKDFLRIARSFAHYFIT